MSDPASGGIAVQPATTAPWIANDATFGARLALIRQRMAWNQKEAALACGIPQQSWRSWESGTMPHGSRYFAVCAQIARATGCDYGWLVDRRPSGASTSPKIRVKLASITGQGRGSQPSLPLLQSVQMDA